MMSSLFDGEIQRKEYGRMEKIVTAMTMAFFNVALENYIRNYINVA